MLVLKTSSFKDVVIGKRVIIAAAFIKTVSWWDFKQWQESKIVIVDETASCKDFKQLTVIGKRVK